MGIDIVKQIQDWDELDIKHQSDAPTPYSFKKK